MRRPYSGREALRAQEPSHGEFGRRLYDLLVRPLAAAFIGADRIEIVADGVLEYLPFACLMDGDRYLAERAAVANRTGIHASTGPRHPMKRWGVAAFGTANAHDSAPALPHVADELATISAMRPEARTYLDDGFTEASLRAALRKKPQIVHIASHFHLEPAAAHRSYLLLGDGGKLSLSEFRSQEIDLSRVELLVLSACDTATTDYGRNGLESLAGLAHAKGAGNVIGSLWPLADVGAAALMKHFYRAYFHGPQAGNATHSLRSAQCALIASSVTSVRCRTMPRGFGRVEASRSLNHPFFWAGLSLYVAEE